MANNYLQFSEVIPRLTPAEEQWLDEQLKVVYMFEGQEYAETNLPAGKDPAGAECRGCRAFRDMADTDSSDEDAGFEYSFGSDENGFDGWGRHLWIYTEEGGDLERVAHLVRKFLKEFRPRECWSLSYATTCSKPRVGEFGGGALFVTAAKIKWQSTHDFIDGERKSFARRQRK